MLKITLHDTPEMLRFQLEGRLVGAWVQEFEQCWRTAVSIRGSRRVVVDLRDVIFIDDPGKDLLRRMRSLAVDFMARDTLTRAIVEEIASQARLLNPAEPVRIQKTYGPSYSQSRRPPGIVATLERKS